LGHKQAVSLEVAVRATQTVLRSFDQAPGVLSIRILLPYLCPSLGSPSFETPAAGVVEGKSVRRWNILPREK